MTCGTPDQVLASIFDLPLWNATLGCDSMLHYFWSDLSGWPFSLLVYLPYFFVTLGLEVLALGVLLKIKKQGLTPKWIKTCVLVNLASHPLVFYMTPWISNAFQIRWDFCLAGAEVFVLVLEALIYQWRTQIGLKKALLYSVLINLVSWWVGSFIFA
jgi:hypothetical protein